MSVLISKIIDLFLKPSNTGVLIGFFLTSIFIFSFNFLPENLLIRIKMLNFLNKYTYIFVIIMIASFFLLVVQIIGMIVKKIKERKVYKFIRQQQEDLYNDPEAMRYLNHLYEHHPNAAKLPIYNQKVKMLEQYKLIHRTTNKIIATNYEIENPYFPFLIQPHAERKMKEIHNTKNSQ